MEKLECNTQSRKTNFADEAGKLQSHFPALTVCFGPNWKCFLLNLIFPFSFILLLFFIHKLRTGGKTKCQKNIRV